MAQLAARLSAVGHAADGLARGVDLAATWAANQAAGVRTDILQNVVTSRPGSPRTFVVDPEASERHYSAAVRLYWTRRYADAEKEVRQAIRSNDQDARYAYYLGLIRLAQGDRDGAQSAFRQAGRLEAQQRPPREVVSASLERLQGADRRLLNSYRP